MEVSQKCLWYLWRTRKVCFKKIPPSDNNLVAECVDQNVRNKIRGGILFWGGGGVKRLKTKHTD